MGLGDIGSGIDLSAALVWSYATRKVTSLNDPTDIIKYLAKGSGSEVPSNKSLYDLIALDRLDHATYGLSALNTDLDLLLTRVPSAALTLAHFDITEIEKSHVSNEQFKDINVVTADQTLGLETIDVLIPEGASVRKAIAVAIVQIMNDAATAQKIDLDLEVDGTLVFSQNDVIGFDAIDGASGSFIMLADVSAIVNMAGAHTLEGLTTLSDAHSTHFTTQYALIVCYRFSP